jgi:DNA-directed RNA polymerase specialized sigma24 family protein
MSIDDQVLHLAQRGDRAAVEALLADALQLVWRTGAALSGREDVARGIARFVLLQSASQIRNWRDAEAAGRWFMHHTVLTARRAVKHQPGARQEILARRGDDAAYIAFVRALRGLPMQPREAFILHYGQGLAMRQLGIAMDCSTQAAELHLRTATESLRPIAGDAFESLCRHLADVHRDLTPPDGLVRPAVRRYLARHVWPRRIRRVLIAAAILAALAGVAWLWIRHRQALPWLKGLLTR